VGIEREGMAFHWSTAAEGKKTAKARGKARIFKASRTGERGHDLDHFKNGCTAVRLRKVSFYYPPRRSRDANFRFGMKLVDGYYIFKRGGSIRGMIGEWIKQGRNICLSDIRGVGRGARDIRRTFLLGGKGRPVEGRIFLGDGEHRQKNVAWRGRFECTIVWTKLPFHPTDQRPANWRRRAFRCREGRKRCSMKNGQKAGLHGSAATTTRKLDEHRIFPVG